MPNSEIILWITQGVIIAFLAFEKAYKLIKGNNAKRNDRNYRVANNPHPCAPHGERLSALETDIKRLREDNTEDHRVIFRALEKLDARFDK